jgi:hypothetical protein
MRSPTRAAFLAAGAAALAGCAKNLSSSVLPGLSPSSAARAPSATPAPPIPKNVLASPIIGEARRFDGATVPAGWTKLAGQSLQVSAYRDLESILGMGGSKVAATFVLPAPKLGWIIAIAGTYASSPRVLAALNRGAGTKLGVSVEGIDVSPAPLRLTPLAPAPQAVELWYPGTPPTAEQIEAASRTQTEITFPAQAPRNYGTPHAVSQ